MNGVHDMGGLENLGRLEPDASSPPFHARWEARVFAMVIASPSSTNIDAGRHARERIPGPEYLAVSYFERWHQALRLELQEGGFVTAAELASGAPEEGGARAAPLFGPEHVRAILTRAGSFVRDRVEPPRFAVGDRVRARDINPSGHTRLPRYVRGREGVVERRHGAHVYPDSHAHGRGEDPQPLYGVRFAATTLWGADADPRSSVSLDIWEPCLERA
jgi:nitrile hydratase